MKTEIILTDPESTMVDAELICFVGRRARLDEDDIRDIVPDGVSDIYDQMLESLDAEEAGAMTSTWLADGRLFVLCELPDRCSRYNTPSRAFSITSFLRDLPWRGLNAVVIASDQAEVVEAQAMAVARAFPECSFKNQKAQNKPVRRVRVGFALPDQEEADVDQLEALMDGVRFCAKLVDLPTNRLNVSEMVDVAREVAARNHAEITVFEGDGLLNAGFEGIYAVGKAGIDPPALVHLSYVPREVPDAPIVAMVGKGVVFDSGGMQVKSRENMVSMKTDMAGAAAVLAAFEAAVRRGCKVALHAVLCLAENAVGPNALRPDDVITMYSGKTVEINNTDAEGRLLLGDGVAYAAQRLSCDVILDMATLTGAQLTATGKKIAAIVTNDELLEARTVEVGRQTGDLVHPLPWAPEFYAGEFRSKVADMKNSVKDRQNAQSCCAAWFVAQHLGEYEGRWLHIDNAGPAVDGEQATGAGVGLLVGLIEDFARQVRG